MRDKTFLMIPGPTPVPENVLQALAKHPMGHRSSEFSAIFKEVTDDLKWVAQTQNDFFILGASGTGAMECAIANTVVPGDKVLSLVIGNFGKRWAQLAKSFGGVVEEMNVPWGEAIDPKALEARLAQDSAKEIKIVTVTHNETSTGVTNDLEAIAKIVKAHGALIIVDAVTSMGVMNLPVDAWKIDVAVSGSQKGFMIPPGLAFITVSKDAWAKYETNKNPKFYWDWKKYKKACEDNSTPFTGSVSLVVALQASLKMMREEGLENVFARHIKLRDGLRAGCKAVGLKLMAADKDASAAITSIWPPEGISVGDIRKGLKNNFDIVVADGQDDFKGKIFRIGHLGFFSQRDLLMTMASLEIVLHKLGHKFELGSGVAAMQKEFIK